MIFNLSSTSYLLERNISWNYLSDQKNLNFSKYGQIFLTNKVQKIDNSININLLFLADLLNLNSTQNFKVELNKIIQVLKKLEICLRNNNIPIIVGVSSYLYINIIESAQNFKNEKRIKHYLFDELYKLSKKYKNLYILDIDEIFSLHGVGKCLDNRNFHLSRCRLSSFGIELIAKNLKKIAIRINKPNKKALLLDCDNTLWGGVIAEDGLNKIRIGEEEEGLAFFEFQKAIKKLKDQGVIIILVSKNIEEDIFNVFKMHGGMILKMKDISAHKINWKDKAKNISTLSKDLNLTLDSFVFWDDNPIEREKIKMKLKEVKVIDPDQDVSNWAKQLLEYEGFSKFSITTNDLNRTKQYQTRQKFIDNKSGFKNEIDYLKSIKIKAKILNLDSRNIDRATQMCQRTNQFNLSTKRYNQKDLLLINKKHKCFMIHLKDLYGDHGIISFVCLKFISKKVILIDTLLMSCRVLGRYLENWILNEIIKFAKKNKVKLVVAEFISTKKNDIAKDFLNSNNFRKISKISLIKKDKTIEKKILKNKSEFFLYNSNKKIDNLNIYAKH